MAEHPSDVERAGACVFCERLASGQYTQSSEHSAAFADAFPVTPGHTLVIPRRHVVSVFELTYQEYADLWSLVRQVRSDMAVDGVNVGINDGALAGQTVFHGHVHLIPRQAGDMPDPRGGIRALFPERAKYWDDD